MNPIRPRARGRHRGATPAELRAAHAEDVRTIDALRGTVTDLMAQLDRAGIDVSGALEDVRVARAELAQAEQAVKDRDRRIADLERRLAVGVRAEHVIADTQPCPTVDGRFEDGPVRRLGASPLADTVEMPRPDAA
ncbi:hypothetical protein CLM85_06355 [Streptomyces albidoflavus]|uniref:hypothetical protein n=1 Tax=Streptomyces albidoflavus TaxID=1886 RepID=UPI000BB66B61|nr:hypothetical protein [Streptomyces albidoflavus]PAX90146.1 hypothetical protein CLM82_17080 [Streptomyces albidoflavus]PBO17356.1 hypothetical protein CLM83_18530 [Streptomyces albidoflavus]PBO25098.1 hypothetical protein CLM85_06355 [Streptomyces albidoflavus]